mmetsp:Transcript_8695/g.35846  ORF Transcript_8695/g.35846 Transcript_8695/m.35846 type:complete len:118 (+) Transcript_8695:3211-3564(+)
MYFVQWWFGIGLAISGGSNAIAWYRCVHLTVRAGVCFHETTHKQKERKFGSERRQNRVEERSALPHSLSYMNVFCEGTGTACFHTHDPNTNNRPYFARDNTHQRSSIQQQRTTMTPK